MKFSAKWLPIMSLVLAQLNLFCVCVTIRSGLLCLCLAQCHVEHLEMLWFAEWQVVLFFSVPPGGKDSTEAAAGVCGVHWIQCTTFNPGSIYSWWKERWVALFGGCKYPAPLRSCGILSLLQRCCCDACLMCYSLDFWIRSVFWIFIQLKIVLNYNGKVRREKLKNHAASNTP